MRAKTANDDNFAVITSGVNNLVYRKFLLEKNIKFQKEIIDHYHIYYGFTGNRALIDRLRTMFD